MKHSLLIAACAALLSTAAPTVHAQAIARKDLAQIQKLDRVMYLLAGAYVDTVDLKPLVETAIREVLDQLDPHSQYIPAEEMESQREEMSGNFEGIGIEFNVLRDTIVVVNTIPGAPAEQVGLAPGDRIVWVNGKSSVGVKTTDVPKILRGPKGTLVEARVVRHGVADTLEFRIVRDKIPMFSLDAAYKVDKQTGYAKLNRFMATTNDELQKALQGELRGVKNLILDLRSNGGGLLDQSILVSANFLPKGSLVLYTEGRAIPRQEAHTETEPLFGKGQLIVLVDEHSASASEIVAGAVQDWDRGLVVGRRTFGKGLVQRQADLGDGSAVRITVAHYYTPSGRSIQRPYKQGNVLGYYREFAERYTSGELTEGRNVVDSSARFQTLVKKRTVYGGGGITPDVIVPLDTAQYTPYWSALVRKGIMLEMVITELDLHRADYAARYKTADSYVRDFTVSEAMIDRLVALGKERGVDEAPAELQRSLPLIRTQMKALIAQRLWNTTAFYQVLNAERDPEFHRALELLAR